MAKNKTLKVEFPDRCNGCELCVMEAQRQLKKVGIDGSPIRIFKSFTESTDRIQFSIDLDSRITELDIEKIKNICPKLVFTIEDPKEEHGLLS